MSSRPHRNVLFALILLAPALPTLAATDDNPRNVATNNFCFNYVDKPLNDIVQDFADRIGRTVKSWPPTKTVTLDCGRDHMKYELALTRLQVVMHSADRHVLRLPSCEEVIEAVPLWTTRWNPSSERIFLSVEEFASRPAPDHYWAMVLHDCRVSAPDVIEPHRHLIPSYVHLATYSDQALLGIFAAVCDVRQYSPLLDMLDITLQDEEAVVEEITLRRAEPDDLAASLVSLYPDTIVYRPLGAARQTEPPDSNPEIRIWTDWAHRRAVVAGTAVAVERARELARILDTPASEM